MIDFIEALILSHHIDRDRVVHKVGDIASLDEDALKTLACDLADGKYGGIGGDRNASHPLQRVKIRVTAQALNIDPLGYIQSIYPDVTDIHSLTRRQATRILATLYMQGGDIVHTGRG